MEKITYLVTNYNNARYVGECLESILNQSSPNWLCIIVDDASTDNSVDVIKNYINEKIKLVINDSNQDQIKSLENLIEMSVTDIVAIVDSDDALESDTTELVLMAYEKSKKIGFVYTNCIEYDQYLKKPLSIGLTERITFGPTSSIVNGHPCHLRSFRKSVYMKTQGYNKKLLYAEDLDLGYKLEEVCLPYFVNKYLYKHRRIPDTRGRKISNKLIGYSNRRAAKNMAIDRRQIKWPLAMLIRCYVYFEYKKCYFSKTGKKVRKYIFYLLMNKMKKVINVLAFKNIKINY